MIPGESDSWSVITVRKKSAAMEMVNRIIAAAVFVIVLPARRLTKPIVSVTDLIRNASDGDFTVRADEGGENEIGVLSESFNELAEKTKNSV